MRRHDSLSVLSADAGPCSSFVDADLDCQSTRQVVLIEESQEPVVLDLRGCKVRNDPYTGETFTNPRQLDIDHFVPLAEVHRSGAHSWDAKKRKAFANDLTDPRSLIAVKSPSFEECRRRVNNSKSVFAIIMDAS